MRIICKIKSVEWLGIDSGMLKLIEKIMNHFLGVITRGLGLPLKIGTFPHMLDKVCIFLVTHCSLSVQDDYPSLVPRPIPSFSMLHAEKREGLVREITWAAS